MMHLFCFLDRISGNWSDPTLSLSLPVLARSLNDALRGTRHPLFQHRGDIDIFDFGEFDQTTGRFPDGVKQEFACRMVDCFPPEEEQKE